MEATIVSTGGAMAARSKRVLDRRGMDSPLPATNPEESLVVDDRCDLSPAQMVETKLTRVLGGGMVPVSLLQMRCMLHRR